MATVGSCFTWLRRWPPAKSGGFPTLSHGSDRHSLAYRLMDPGGIPLAGLFTTKVIPPGPQPIHLYRSLFHSGTYWPRSSFLPLQSCFESQISSPYSHSIVLG